MRTRLSTRERSESAELLAVLEAFEAAAPVGLGFVDRDFRIVRLNDTLAAVNGLPAEQQVGRTVAEIVPDLWAELEPAYRHVLDTGEATVGREIAGRSAAAGGMQRYWWTSFHPVRIDDRVIGVGIVAFDITARKRVEQELQAAKDYADRLIETSNAIVIVLDPDANIVTFNRAAEEITGYTREEVKGRNWDLLLPRDRYPEAWIEFSRPGGHGAPPRYKNPVVTKSGEERMILWQNSQLHDRAGEVVGLVSFGIDVTEAATAKEHSQLLETRLRQAEKMEAVGQLAGGVAHDFNNLLVAIRGYAELALGRLQRGEDGVAADVERVIASADRGAGLTRQLLALGRRQVLNPEVLDLNEVVEDTDMLLQRVIGDNVELVISLSERPVMVKADRGQLGQVITNLAVNGRDAMAGGGRLTIRVGSGDLDGGAAPRYAVLSVTDEGSGIDAATASQIFEPFFTTKGEDGTGLGLATVHGIVAQSGGQVALDTELGRGSTFTVYLPLSMEGASPPRAASESTDNDGTERILLVEDDPTVRTIVTLMLRSRGYEVIHTSSGEEAIRSFEARTRPIELVVSDLIMSGLDGRQTTDRIRLIEPATKVLYMSGYSEDVTIRSGGLDGATAFIQKPFSGDELAVCVRELLDRVAA